jgi:orotate phosphoribosyltransferase
VDAVLSPAIGGLIIGHEVARSKKCRAIFSEKDDQGKPVLRRGFQLRPQDKILVIEDVITTGLSTSEVIHLVEASGAKLTGIGSIVNRAGERNEKLKSWEKLIHSLLVLDVKQWSPNECQLCKEGIPAIKPGSRKI